LIWFQNYCFLLILSTTDEELCGLPLRCHPYKEDHPLIECLKWLSCFWLEGHRQCCHCWRGFLKVSRIVIRPNLEVYSVLVYSAQDLVTWFTGWSSLRVNLPVSELSRLWFFMKNKLITKPFESKKKNHLNVDSIMFYNYNYNKLYSIHVHAHPRYKIKVSEDS